MGAILLVLGIETSCDETGIALYNTDTGLLGHVVYSQVQLHADYGGVVPELASRDHIRKILPLTRQLLADHHLNLDNLDAIAYTSGPGLMGALLVGATFGRTLAWSLGIPSIGVHHMEAHLLAPLIKMADATDQDFQAPPFPFLALLVSGGHTQLMQVNNFGDYVLLGQSLDDAAGEAFDKAAKMMDLGYPGGPKIAEKAASGTPDRFRFPRPMTDRPGLDFSFSGLKTYTLNTAQAHAPLSEKDKADIALAFEDAVVDTLFIKCRRAVEQTGIDHLIMAGGVSANRKLRTKLENDLAAAVYYAPGALCTDNGAMVAYAGALRLLGRLEQDSSREQLGIDTRPRWPMTELAPFSA